MCVGFSYHIFTTLYLCDTSSKNRRFFLSIFQLFLRSRNNWKNALINLRWLLRSSNFLKSPAKRLNQLDIFFVCMRSRKIIIPAKQENYLDNVVSKWPLLLRSSNLLDQFHEFLRSRKLFKFVFQFFRFSAEQKYLNN